MLCATLQTTLSAIAIHCSQRCHKHVLDEGECAALTAVTVPVTQSQIEKVPRACLDWGIPDGRHCHDEKVLTREMRSL